MDKLHAQQIIDDETSAPARVGDAHRQCGDVVITLGYSGDITARDFNNIESFSI